MIIVSVILLLVGLGFAAGVSWYITRGKARRMSRRVLAEYRFSLIDGLFCGCYKPYYGVGGMCAGHCATGRGADMLRRAVIQMAASNCSPASLVLYRALLWMVTRGDKIDAGKSVQRFDDFRRDGEFNLTKRARWMGYEINMRL